MKIRLSEIPVEKVVGIYIVDGVKKQMPKRTRHLHPSAARSFLCYLSKFVVVSDMYRSADSSLAAVASGRGALPPGYSSHNYGLAIDIDIAKTMKNLGFKTKQLLDVWMRGHGWYCHRVDHTMGKEAWHYTFLGMLVELTGKPLVISPKVKSTYGYIEQLMQLTYGGELTPGPFECQAMLAKLHMYSGKIDGKIGPISKSAIMAFQRAWALSPTGNLDARTKRTLAFLSADREAVAT